MSTKRKCDIFISYRRDGGDMTAMYIYQALKERNYDVFYDLEVLRAGRFNDHLLEYIASCTDFILILSPKALDRCSEEDDWVRREIAEALRLKKNIIPIMLKGFSFPQELPDDIDDVRYQNGLTTTTEYFQESMNRLCTKYLRTKPQKKLPLAAGIAAAAVLIAALALFAAKDALFAPKPDPVLLVPETTAEAAQETTAATVATTPEPAKLKPVHDTDWPIMRSDNPWELYDGRYGEETENMPVFQNEAIARKDVSSVTILNTLADAGKNAWDISQAQDGSVLAWTVKNGERCDLYIAGEGGVKASENCAGLFRGYTHAVTIALNGNLDTSETSNFDHFFALCKDLKTLDLRTMDTSNADSFGCFLTWCSSLTAVDVSSFDTSRATNMTDMFSAMYSLKSLDLSNFNTSRVTNMSAMFAENPKLQKLTLGAGFDTSRVKSMNGMFHANEALRELDVSGFRTANVEDMGWMFWGCEKLLELDVSGFDTAKVQTMFNMFSNCTMLDGLDLSGWNTNSVSDMRNIFTGCDSLQRIGVAEGKLYAALNQVKNAHYSRRLFYDAETAHTVRVVWSQGEQPVACAFASDESTGHSYVFVNCPATAPKANGFWGDGRHLVSINSEAELEFLQDWAQRDGLDLNETWSMGICDPVAVYSEQDAQFDLKAVWKESSDNFLQGWGHSGEAYFCWEDGQPDGSGHYLQLWQIEENGQIRLTMDDLNDDLRRPFILEFDRVLDDGEEIDLSWYVTGGNGTEGYGEEYAFNDGSRGRLGEDGVLIVSGTGATDLTQEIWYNLYIREVVIREGMKEIGANTFSGCSNLTRVTLPESLEVIGPGAFAGTGLTTITIPSGVREIHNDTFDSVGRDLTICAEAGSYAESYAKNVGFQFQAQ